MRLGEGTGAALGINLIETAVRLYTEMATFSEASVSRNPE
jgi:nicotinate-nucleotide--dimethylbenzimidazole phosphoribosyltransferase